MRSSNTYSDRSRDNFSIPINEAWLVAKLSILTNQAVNYVYRLLIYNKNDLLNWVKYIYTF